MFVEKLYARSCSLPFFVSERLGGNLGQFTGVASQAGGIK